MFFQEIGCILPCGKKSNGNSTARLLAICILLSGSPSKPLKMINKIVNSIAEALVGVENGSIVMVGGFGNVGVPRLLLDGLIEQGATDLTIVSNTAGSGHEGIARLIELGRVRKAICSFPRSQGSVVFEEVYRQGRIELELVAQGTLAERIRAAGAGVTAFYTPTAVGTLLAKGKETREMNGRTCVLEQALYADLALVEAWKADRWGNLTYNKAGRNFNAVMATAGKRTVAMAHYLVEVGELDPEAIVTPGIFVDYVVQGANDRVDNP